MQTNAMQYAVQAEAAAAERCPIRIQRMEKETCRQYTAQYHPSTNHFPLHASFLPTTLLTLLSLPQITMTAFSILALKKI
jgi:hypothetical protein